MYYYLMEQPKTKSQNYKLQKIKDILGGLGITGEIATPSAAHTLEELTEIGLAKGYSTLVAIGNERHVSKIVAAILGKDIVLGIIPTDKRDFSLKNLIGVSNLYHACETLKYRKVTAIDLAKIEPNSYFLSSAFIQTDKPTAVKIDFENFQIQTSFTTIEISRDLKISLNDKTLGPGFLKKFFVWLLGRKLQDISQSLLSGQKIKIETTDPLPVKVASQVVAKTPISVNLLPAALKIITCRDKLKKKE